MQVLILATDEQRTLSPLTDTQPTAMLPIVDRPVMAPAVEIVARFGVKQVLVSLYERGGQIASYFGSGRSWGVDIKYVTQRQGWGSAGALRWAGSLLRETCLVLPGDRLCDLDIEAALHFHQAHGGLMSAILHAPRETMTAASPELDEQGKIISVRTAANADALQYTGAFICEPEVLRYIPAAENFDLTTDLLPALLAAGEAVYGFTMTGYWNPLLTLADYQEAQQVYLYSAFYEQSPAQAKGGPSERVRFAALRARLIAPGVWVGPDHSIHPTMQLAAPVYIGASCWIGREVELGAGTVLGRNVVIDDEATVNNSSVLSNTYVGRLVRVESKVVTSDTICDPATGETTRVVDPFLISRVGATHEGRSLLRRVFSSVVAFGLIALFSPLFLVAALLTLLGGGGQLLARAPRVGQQRPGTPGSLRMFQLVNFRTRRANGTYRPFGRLLERWELHRLPELFNVLNGDLELVGVKPLRPEEAERLSEDWQQRRHEVPAGLTGLWYLQTGAESELDTVIVTDVYYTATRSWRNDILLLLRTPHAWWRHHCTHQQKPMSIANQSGNRAS